MRLNKVLIVGCLILGLPSASFAAKFNQDDLFKTVPTPPQSKTVTPASPPAPAATPNTAGAFASTVSSIKDADRKAKARKFLPIANAKIAEEPNNAQYYLARAQIYKDLEDYNTAFSDVNQAVKLNPSAQQLFAFRSSLWSSVNKPTEALKDIEIALSIGPQTAELLNAKVTNLLVSGRLKEALIAGNRAVQSHPESSYAYAIRGLVKYDLKDYTGSDVDCRKAESLGSTESVTTKLRQLLNLEKR